ncbi:hypothetical protein L571_1761 [Bordetella pertussis 2371640]|nr:hypothetical protein L571_1761 [Bordetella pertussis 2371640]
MTALTQHAPVLEIYQDIANLTSRMLAAANASNWDLVLNHGQEYVCLVERLRELEPGEPLDEAARGMKFDRPAGAHPRKRRGGARPRPAAAGPPERPAGTHETPAVAAGHL